MYYKNVTTKNIKIEGNVVASGEVIKLDEKKCTNNSYIRMGYLVPVNKPNGTKKPKKRVKRIEPKEEKTIENYEGVD
jgi:hypothetical protein